MCAVRLAGINGGAVYRPFASIVPFAGPSVTLQTTALLARPVTVALNCCCFLHGSECLYVVERLDETVRTDYPPSGSTESIARVPMA
jgi:hypothetical protein